MPSRTPKDPSYRLHRPSGQAVVTLSGRDFYLGRFGSVESHERYGRLIREWKANHRLGAVDPADLTIVELLARYMQHAAGYYVKNGRPTSEIVCLESSFRPLRRLYGSSLAREFGPLCLTAVRAEFIEAGCCRSVVNGRVRRIVRLFKWGLSQQLVPPMTHHALTSVEGLRAGRSEARESEPVTPVRQEFIDAIKPYLSRQVAAMVQLQLLTGMRPGEVCQMRTCDLDMSGDEWSYTPGSHKTEHHSKSRVVYIGPQAQRVLAPWVKTDLVAPLFQPLEVVEELRAVRHANRKRVRQKPLPSRRKRRPKRVPGAMFSTNSYRNSIARACRKAGIPEWAPNALRHSFATIVRREAGIDAAKVLLGHSDIRTTTIYAERDVAMARQVIRRIG
jgi:integrase